MTIFPPFVDFTLDGAINLMGPYVQRIAFPSVLLITLIACLLPSSSTTKTSPVVENPRAPLRLALHLLLFILLRDAMTPAGIWKIGPPPGASDNWLFISIRFTSCASALIIAASTCLMSCVAIHIYEPLAANVIWRPKTASLAACIGYGLVGAVVIAMPFALLMRSTTPTSSQSVVEPVSPELFIPLAIITFISNAWEELLFRGLLQSYLEGPAGFSRTRAAVASGLAFTACHVVLASAVTSVGTPLLLFTMYEGIIAGLLRDGQLCGPGGVLTATIAHGGGIWLLSSGVLGV